MSQPFKCPVCNGSGKYRVYHQNNTTSSCPYTDQNCHGCYGTGIVWSPPEPMQIDPENDYPNPTSGSNTFGGALEGLTWSYQEFLTR